MRLRPLRREYDTTLVSMLRGHKRTPGEAAEAMKEWDLVAFYLENDRLER
jgi:hypothetical protein